MCMYSRDSNGKAVNKAKRKNKELEIYNTKSNGILSIRGGYLSRQTSGHIKILFHTIKNILDSVMNIIYVWNYYVYH